MSSVNVKFTVEYSLKQWLCVIFLGGFIWMQYTQPGPFSLWQEIGNLFNYGLFNALGDLFRDWLNR